MGFMGPTPFVGNVYVGSVGSRYGSGNNTKDQVSCASCGSDLCGSLLRTLN